jgi:cobalt-zinc-cadmium efflux system outer membrane protein
LDPAEALAPHPAQPFQSIKSGRSFQNWRRIGVRRWFGLLLALFAGCRAVHPVDATPAVIALDANVEAVAVKPSAPEVQVCTSATAPTAVQLDLPSLWSLALANNPSLREAAGDVEVARGRLIQAGKYPNPSFSYEEEAIGSPQAPAGTIRMQVSQPIVTAGKRPLDIGVADRTLSINQLALLGRKFAVLTLVRRAYYEYVGLEASVRVSEEVVASLQRAVEITRKQVEEARTRPRTDVLRLEALLVNARTTLGTNRSNRDAAWRQLATQIGLPEDGVGVRPLQCSSAANGAAYP